jgi:hypothetical protein
VIELHMPVLGIWIPKMGMRCESVAEPREWLPGIPRAGHCSSLMEKCASEKSPVRAGLFSGVPLFSHSVASVRWPCHSSTWPLATQCENRGIFQ